MLNCLFKMSLWLVILLGWPQALKASDSKHLDDVRTLLNLTHNENTVYTNGAPRVTWKGFNGATTSSCFADSSSLLNAILAHSYGYSPLYFHLWLGAERPLAYHYYQAIVMGNRFQPIANIADVRAGDILSISFADNSGTDIGHVAIVDKQPSFMNQKQPYVDGAQQWSITVIDCAFTAHGVKDSRYLGGGNYSTGLGRGVIRLYINVHGNLVGYTWSRNEDSPFYPASLRPLAIGRLIF